VVALAVAALPAPAGTATTPGMGSTSAPNHDVMPLGATRVARMVTMRVTVLAGMPRVAVALPRVAVQIMAPMSSAASTVASAATLRVSATRWNAM
jgi:hypothetical protein